MSDEMFFSLVPDNLGSERLQVSLSLLALTAHFSPPLSRWAPSPPMPWTTDSGHRG